MRYSCPVKYGTCRVPYKPNPYNRVTAQSRSAPYVPSSTTLGLAMKLIRSHLCRYIITQSRLVYVSHQTTTVQSGVYCIVGLHSDSSYRYRLEICNNILARFWKKNDWCLHFVCGDQTRLKTRNDQNMEDATLDLVDPSKGSRSLRCDRPGWRSFRCFLGGKKFDVGIETLS